MQKLPLDFFLELIQITTKNIDRPENANLKLHFYHLLNILNKQCFKLNCILRNMEM